MTEHVYTFAWNHFSINKSADWFDSVTLAETNYLNIDMCSSESSHNYESRVQSDDSSKACSKHRFFLPYLLDCKPHKMVVKNSQILLPMSMFRV